MNKEERQVLMDELWRRDDPHVMIVRYDDKLERIGTQAETVTFHTNPMHAIDAFYRLLTGPESQWKHHAFLKNGQYLMKWLNAHSNSQKPPTPNDLVGEVMSDLTEDRTVRHKITHLKIIEYLEYHTRDHGTPAQRLEATMDLPLSTTSDDAYAVYNDQPSIDPGPDPELPEGEMPSTGPLIDTDQIVMFDHNIPPVWVPARAPGEYSFLDDEVQA